MGCTANFSLQSVLVINTHLFAAIFPFLGPPSKMVFWDDLGLRLHSCLCGGLQVASVQTLDFTDVGQTGNPTRRGGIEHAQRVRNREPPRKNGTEFTKKVKHPAPAPRGRDWARAAWEEKSSFPRVALENRLPMDTHQVRKPFVTRCTQNRLISSSISSHFTLIEL